MSDLKDKMSLKSVEVLCSCIKLIGIAIGDGKGRQDYGVFGP